MATKIPENQAQFTLREIVRVTRGRIVGPFSDDEKAQGVSTDSRAKLQGKVFIALRGEHFDAHRFLQQAVANGARVLVVEEQEGLSTLLAEQGLKGNEGLGALDPTIVVVEDTLVALGAMAEFHRKRWTGKLAIVAGSAGKTTTRSIASRLLEVLRPGEVHATVGNLNNRIGVPMVLFGLSDQHSFAVVEIGTNRPGEVRILTEMTQPDLAVITLIDFEHTEGLGDLDGVEVEERQAFSLFDGEGIAVGFGEDPRVLRSVEGAEARLRLTYGFGPNHQIRIVSRKLQIDLVERVLLRRQDGSELEVCCPLLGRPNVLALAAGVTVAEALTQERLSPAQVESALERAGEQGRTTVSELQGGVLLIDDSYNASPASVAACIETGQEMSEVSGGRLWLVLGEMLELGSLSGEAHAEMGRLARASGAAGAAFVQGDAEIAFSVAAGGLPWVKFFSASNQVAADLAKRIFPRDVIVVKASRGVRGERVVEGLAELLGSTEGSSRAPRGRPPGGANKA